LRRDPNGCDLLGTPQPLALSSVRTSAQDLGNSPPTLDEVFFLLPKWSFGTRRSEACGSHLCGRNFIAWSGWWKQICGRPPNSNSVALLHQSTHHFNERHFISRDRKPLKPRKSSGGRKPLLSLRDAAFAGPCGKAAKTPRRRQWDQSLKAKP
jgi:hypothetical protein